MTYNTVTTHQKYAKSMRKVPLAGLDQTSSPQQNARCELLALPEFPKPW